MSGTQEEGGRPEYEQRAYIGGDAAGKFDRVEKMTVERAEQKIADIVMQLERDCSCTVTSVDINEVEVTTFGNDRITSISRSVSVNAVRISGKVF